MIAYFDCLTVLNDICLMIVTFKLFHRTTVAHHTELLPVQPLYATWINVKCNNCAKYYFNEHFGVI